MTTTKDQEQRRWPRSRISATAIVERDGLVGEYEVIDVSAGGMRLRGDALPVDQDLLIVLHIARTDISAPGRVVWCQEPKPDSADDDRCTIGVEIEVEDILLALCG